MGAVLVEGAIRVAMDPERPQSTAASQPPLPVPPPLISTTVMTTLPSDSPLPHLSPTRTHTQLEITVHGMLRPVRERERVYTSARIWVGC
jgi:hypothetical protein